MNDKKKELKKEVFSRVFSYIDGTPWDDVPNNLIDTILTAAGYWELVERVSILRDALIAAGPYLPGAVLTNNMGRCVKCGVPTSSGMKKHCSKCVREIVQSALSQTE